MGLFKNLLRLFTESVPQENFLTEIVAYLFRADPDLLEAWLSYINLAVECALLLVDRFGEDDQARALLESALARSDDEALKAKIEAALKPLRAVASPA